MSLPDLVNVGCGKRPLLRAVNVDARSSEECEITDSRYIWVQGDFFSLPFPDETFRRLVAAHAIEHVGHHETQRLISEWARVIVIGGEIHIKCPNVESFARRICESKEDPSKQEALLHILWGGQDYPSNFHLNGFTPKTLQKALKRGGFGDFQLGLIRCYTIEDAIISIKGRRCR